MSVYGEEMLKFELLQYNEGTFGRNFDNANNCDLEVKLNMGRARIVFVNKFIKSLTVSPIVFGAAHPWFFRFCSAGLETWNQWEYHVIAPLVL